MYVQVRDDLQTQPFRNETLFSFELVKFDRLSQLSISPNPAEIQHLV